METGVTYGLLSLMYLRPVRGVVILSDLDWKKKIATYPYALCYKLFKGHNIETSICRILTLCFGKKWLLIKEPKPDHDSGESQQWRICLCCSDICIKQFRINRGDVTYAEMQMLQLKCETIRPMSKIPPKPQDPLPSLCNRGSSIS